MRNVRSLLIAGVVLVVPALALANGFALFEHGGRPVGMAGAFGAIADEPSAGYYNPAGLAFLDGMQATDGFFLITETSKFTGDNPYPGEGYATKMESQIFYPPHIYATGAVAGNLRWGLAVTAPFGLGTWWPDDYAGKFITKRIDLKVFNINPSFAYKIGDNFALAVGADYFISQVDLTKSIGVVNPYTQQVAEVGQVHLYNPNWASGWGYNAAVLAKLGAGFSAGMTYRSRVEVKYDKAEASFVQFPTGHADFDAIVASMLPFGDNVPGETSITYPAELRAALAWQKGGLTVAFDAVRMGWDSFKTLPITIVGRPDLSSNREENYKDTTTYRLGMEYRTSPKFAFQLGVLKDPTPVPTDSVSPLLPDADRMGYSAGLSWNLSPKVRADVAYLFLPFDTRSTDGLDHDNYNGTYKTTANLLGFSLVVKL